MQTPRVHTPIECVDVKLSTLDNAYTGLSWAHGDATFWVMHTREGAGINKRDHNEKNATVPLYVVGSSMVLLFCIVFFFFLPVHQFTHICGRSFIFCAPLLQLPVAQPCLPLLGDGFFSLIYHPTGLIILPRGQIEMDRHTDRKRERERERKCTLTATQCYRGRPRQWNVTFRNYACNALACTFDFPFYILRR